MPLVQTQTVELATASHEDYTEPQVMVLGTGSVIAAVS